MIKSPKIERPSEQHYINRGVFNLCFCQSVIILWISFDTFVTIPFLIISFFLLKSLFISFKYYISVEECYYEDEKFCYKKTLFQKWTLREFSLPVLEIEKIEDRGKKILRKASNMWNVFYYVYYFKIHERVCIQMKNGEQYYIWNFVKSPSLDCVYDNSADSDEEFLNSFQELEKILEEGKKDAKHQVELREWESIYSGRVEERYTVVLQQILQEEKIFMRKENGILIINACEDAILYLGIFQNIPFEEIDFYQFYLDYLSNKKYENTLVRVADNGRDYKEVTMKQLKEDINKLRDER